MNVLTVFKKIDSLGLNTILKEVQSYLLLVYFLRRNFSYLWPKYFYTLLPLLH